MAKNSKAKKEDSLQNLPSVLSIKRSVNITDALMKSCSSKDNKGDLVALFEEAHHIEVFEHGQRVTAAFASDKESGNSETGNESRNLCYGEMAMLPGDADTLLIQFSGTFLPAEGRIDQCDSMEWTKALETAYPLLINKAGKHVANCYAYHLCSGIWLWRNREDAESVSIVVEYGDDNKNRVNIAEVLDIPTHAVKQAGSEGIPNYEEYGKTIPGFFEFSAEVNRALSGEMKNKINEPTGLHFRVTASCKMKRRQLVHPSQLFLPIKEKVGKSEVGRVFYKIGNTAGITYAKLGNALRRFDNSHGYENFIADILPTEPNGGSLSRGENMRGRGRKNDFYNYMHSVIAQEGQEDSGNAINNLSLNEAAYILGVLVRGGVFVEENSKAKKETRAASAAKKLEESAQAPVETE